MVWRKILVVTEYAADMSEVLEFFEWSVDEFVSGLVLLTRHAVLVETCYSVREVDLEFSGLELTVIDIDGVDLRVFLEERLADAVEMAVRAMDISGDLDYFLDLIIERGGVHMLSDKERRRLDQLSR